jgi:hypothetical protein
MKHSLKRSACALAVLAALAASRPAFADLIPIGTVDMTGTGLGAVNTVLTFQNTGTEVGAVGLDSSGATVTGSTVAYGIPGFPSSGGSTDEQTGSGNNTYTASSLGLASGSSTDFSNIVLIFNGSEGGNPADQPITLTDLALNLYSSSGALLGSFTTASPYNIMAFPGTGVAGYGFQLDDVQAAEANALLAANPTLTIGSAARATGSNSGLESIFISTLAGSPPSRVPDAGGTMVLLGMAMVGLFGLRRAIRI